MVEKFNIGVVIKLMLEKILRFTILLILYIDLKLLYNYLVKLGILKKST